MKKVLITILFMLAAIGAYGQNKYKYPINANGGLRVGGDDHNLIDSVKLSGGTLIFYIGGVEYTTAADTTAIDTTSLSDRIDLKLNFADTSVMLTPYINRADTADMLANYLKIADIVGKLNITDTSDMLNPYALLSEVGTGDISASDTSDMLTPYIREAEVSSTYSNKALSNLSSVAINSNLLPNAAGTIDLGSATYPFNNVDLDSASVIRFNNAETITHSDDKLTIDADLDIGSNKFILDGNNLEFTLSGNTDITLPTSGIMVTNASPSFTGTTTTAALNIGGTTLALDSATLVGGKLAFFDGVDTLSLHINVTDLEDLSTLAVMLEDSITVGAGHYVTPTQLSDSLTAFEGGLSSGDVAAQINDTITARLAVAVPGVKVADTAAMLEPYALLSEIGGVGVYVEISDTSTMLTNYILESEVAADYIAVTDTATMLDPYFTESEIRVVDSDTISLFIFGAGSGGLESDTALFTTDNIYGVFYNKESDTLIVTELRAVMIEGTTPLGDDTLSIQIYWNDTINIALGDSYAKLNTNPLGINNVKVGTTDTSFDNASIPPNVWVWCKTPGVVLGRKPKALYVQLTGYKRNRSY
jgi:hypothetical protein